MQALFYTAPSKAYGDLIDPDNAREELTRKKGIIRWGLLIGIADRGAGGCSPQHWKNLQKSTMIGQTIRQNFRKQWIFCRAAPLNFIFPYAHGHIHESNNKGEDDSLLELLPQILLNHYTPRSVKCAYLTRFLSKLYQH